MKDIFEGYFLIGKQLKNKSTGVYETVYCLYDRNKLIGVFTDDIYAIRFWKTKYIPSRRTELKINEEYEGV